MKRVAHHKLIDKCRQVARQHPHIALDTIAETLLATDNPEQLLLPEEEHGQLQAASNKLPRLQQQVLRSADGLRYSEIASLVTRHEGTIRKMLSRSIVFLRQVYQKAEGEQTGETMPLLRLLGQGVIQPGEHKTLAPGVLWQRKRQAAWKTLPTCFRIR